MADIIRQVSAVFYWPSCKWRGPNDILWIHAQKVTAKKSVILRLYPIKGIQSTKECHF